MRALIVAVPLFLISTEVLAEIAVAQSVEWMVADSDLVVRARFLHRVDFDGLPAGFSVSSYRVEETFLGEPRKHVDVFARDRSEEDGVEGAEYLLFLGRHCRRFTNAELSAAADRTPLEFRGQVRLDAPLRQYTMACEIVTERADLLERVRGAVRHTRGAVARPLYHWLEVPTGSPAFWDLYGGSAVYMGVPVDGRLVRLAQSWVGSEEQDRREAAEESLRVVGARARTLERIAGSAAPEPGESGDLGKRLAKAEAGVAALRAPVLRAIEACRDNAPQEALLRLRLCRLSTGPEDREAVVEVFRHDLDALAAAASETLWPVTLDIRREGTRRIVELCERTKGRMAFNVLQLNAYESGKLAHVTTVEERLYCFADEAGPEGFRAFYLDLDEFSFGDTLPNRAERNNGRGAARTVPAGMELESLRLSPENLRHWRESVPGYWPTSAPAWAAPFLFEEFREAFPPGAPNRKGETDPERR